MPDSKFSSFLVYFCCWMSFSYGPMGESIILSTLDRLFPDVPSDTKELASTLHSVFDNEMSESEDGDLLQRFWEGTKTNPCPIALRDFLTYLVVPETAVLLIAKELGVTNAQANYIRLKSKEYGKAFYSATDDGRIDNITSANVQALVRLLCSFNTSFDTPRYSALNSQVDSFHPA
jgi:hypothetical protein